MCQFKPRLRKTIDAAECAIYYGGTADELFGHAQTHLDTDGYEKNRVGSSDETELSGGITDASTAGGE